jgi:hypothetical protein
MTAFDFIEKAKRRKQKIIETIKTYANADDPAIVSELLYLEGLKATMFLNNEEVEMISSLLFPPELIWY